MRPRPRVGPPENGRRPARRGEARHARQTSEAWTGAGVALPRRFYERPAPRVARDLLGRVLVSRIGGRLTAGRIVETEAYLGPEDGASHAAFRPSSRWLFYGPGGIAYVFRAYGLNDCLNAIAGPRNTPGCVLIRALEPLTGIVSMARRRNRPIPDGRSVPALAALTSGPGRLTQALGITLRRNGHDLRRWPLRIEGGPSPLRTDVVRSTRVGITRSRDLQLRFSLRGNPFVSRSKGSGAEHPSRSHTATDGMASVSGAPIRLT